MNKSKRRWKNIQCNLLNDHLDPVIRSLEPPFIDQIDIKVKSEVAEKILAQRKKIIKFYNQISNKNDKGRFLKSTVENGNYEIMSQQFEKNNNEFVTEVIDNSEFQSNSMNKNVTKDYGITEQRNKGPFDIQNKLRKNQSDKHFKNFYTR